MDASRSGQSLLQLSRVGGVPVVRLSSKLCHVTTSVFVEKLSTLSGTETMALCLIAVARFAANLCPLVLVHTRVLIFVIRDLVTRVQQLLTKLVPVAAQVRGSNVRLTWFVTKYVRSC